MTGERAFTIFIYFLELGTFYTMKCISQQVARRHTHRLSDWGFENIRKNKDDDLRSKVRIQVSAKNAICAIAASWYPIRRCWPISHFLRKKYMSARLFFWTPQFGGLSCVNNKQKREWNTGDGKQTGCSVEWMRMSLKCLTRPTDNFGILESLQYFLGSSKNLSLEYCSVSLMVSCPTSLSSWRCQIWPRFDCWTRYVEQNKITFFLSFPFLLLSQSALIFLVAVSSDP